MAVSREEKLHPTILRVICLYEIIILYKHHSPYGIAGTSTINPNEEVTINKDENWPEQTQRQPVKPLIDPHVVQEFLLGQHCLYGGSGWWKYEFCYGQKVDQYHEEKGGPHGTKKTVLNLGRFDMAKHKEWIDQNPSKKPKPIETRKHVSHFYSGGDICDITGKLHLQPSF